MTAVRRPSALALAALVCLALGAVSLLLPSGPTYDPYQWLIWGRELFHLQLDTTGTGTSWKPLTALIAALLAPLGNAQPDAWLAIARAGGLFAAFMTFRLAARFAPRGWGWPAGFAAAATFVLTDRLVRQTATGNIEALTSGLVLLAVERHLDGRRGQALGLGVAAALMRPECWPFLLAYGAWLWHARERPPRAALAAGIGLVPLLWFGGDWIGSGRLSTESDRALQTIPGTPGASAHPLEALVRVAWGLVPGPARVLLPVALAIVVLDVWRSRRAVVVAALAAGGFAWVAVVALMTLRGYPGEGRFMFPAVALFAVVLGYGIARLGESLPLRVPRRLRLAAPLAAALVSAMLVAPGAARLRGDARAITLVASQDNGLEAAIERVGGAHDVFACGQPATGWWAVPALAYYLGVHPARVHDIRDGRRPVVFVARRAGWRVVDGCAVRSATPRARRVPVRAGSRVHGRRAAHTSRRRS